MPNRKLLIDADIVAYAVATRLDQSAIDWDGDGKVAVDSAAALEASAAFVERLKVQLEAAGVILCLSDKSRKYFRHTIYPEYKAHRTHGTSPQHLDAVKEAMRNGLGTKLVAHSIATLEADDVMGIIATSPKQPNVERVIVTNDKDLRQIPGRIYYLNKPERGVEIIKEAEADLWFYTQVLTGDPTDGFPGCPGIGPKKAEKILLSAFAQQLDPWPAIVAAYERVGLKETDALIQARVARICRHSDYDFVKKEVIPWTPTSVQQSASSPSSSSPDSA